jgi:hypothetical protein
MANTLTNLIPDVYAALDVVSRELTGLIPAVTLDPSTSRAAVGQTVYSHVAPAATAGDITPAVTPPDDGDQTIGNVSLAVTKARRVPFRWNGEQSLQMNNGGFGVLSIQQNQIAQAIRTLVNEMEADLAALHTTFSRAYGTAAATPFGTAGDFTDASNAMKILKDNGGPLSDNHLVVNTAAGANLIGKQSRVDIQGDLAMLRQGVLLDTAGMMIRESGAIVTSTAGTASSATTNNAGYAIGTTTLTLASAGTGTLVAGDVITFAGDSNQYVVVSGDADVSGGGTITIAAPGLRVAMSAATKAITVVAAAARNMAFNRSALILATRAPALPDGGDAAADRSLITDPRSGLSFELSMYKQYRQIQYEVAAAWGVKNVKPEHTALLLG